MTSSGSGASENSSPVRLSRTTTLRVFPSRLQNSETWIPALSREASSSICVVALIAALTLRRVGPRVVRPRARRSVTVPTQGLRRRRLIAMPPARDLRDWIARLEREGELVRVEAEVDPELEITEINDRTAKAGGPALLFENVKGSERPLLINQFGTERRMAMAFDAPSLDAVAEKLADVLEMQPPQGLAEKMRGLQKLKSIPDSRPKTVRSAPSQEIVLPGDDASLDLLPIQKCWPDDAAPFITLPAVITHDPRSGTRNVGMYRMQKLGPRATAMHWQIHKDGRADYLATDGKIEVVVALGVDPVTTYAASAPLPKHIDELMLAGFLRGGPVELVGAKTVEIDVPANAEIILEGFISKDELAEEGPFGDHTGYYTPPERFPVFHLTAMTMRRDAIYPSIVVGKPPQEDAALGA